MAQHDMIIANQTAPNFRSDINDALAALVTCSSGTSAPSTTSAYMLWADTTNALLKQRNAANSGWITLGDLGETDLGLFDGSRAILGTYGAFGTTPALSGTVRMPSTGKIQARNAANSADLVLMTTNAADVVQINIDTATATVANDGTVNLGGLQTGLLVIVSNFDHTALFVLSNLITYEVSDPDSKYSVTQDNAGTINLYNSAGSVILQNKSGGSRSFYITNIK